MIFRKKISEFASTFLVRARLSKDFTSCGLRAPELRSFYTRLDVPGVGPMHYAALVTKRLRGDEWIRFTGTSAGSAVEAAAKAFSEYLEAVTLWDLGATEEESRSGWACGDTVKRAEERAYRELLERDSLIMHFLCPQLKSEKILRPGLEENCHLVRLQCVDSRYTCVAGAYYFPEKNRWLIGASCDPKPEEAMIKALCEVYMMKKDWSDAPPKSEEKQPKRAAFWSHWQSPDDPKVALMLQGLFSGSGDQICHWRVPENRFSRKALRVFSSQHVVVGGSHPDLNALSFGESWRRSEGKIREQLLFRGLRSADWIVHPML